MQRVHIPKDPTKDRLADGPDHRRAARAAQLPGVNVSGEKRPEILVASYEGVSLLSKGGDKWEIARLGEGNQANPAKNRGSSEIKLGQAQERHAVHRHDRAVAREPGGRLHAAGGRARTGTRHVIDDQLMWGHAVLVADLDGDGDDELVIGVARPAEGEGRERRPRLQGRRDGGEVGEAELDPGGVAVEDLAVADLNGDGRPDIVAVGRATKNVRIYWNEGKREARPSPVSEAGPCREGGRRWSTRRHRPEVAAVAAVGARGGPGVRRLHGAGLSRADPAARAAALLAAPVPEATRGRRGRPW